MIADLDFCSIQHPLRTEPPKHIWVIPNNVHEIVLCNFVVELWTILDTRRNRTACLCAKSLTNVFDYITAVCLEHLCIIPQCLGCVQDRRCCKRLRSS